MACNATIVPSNLLGSSPNFVLAPAPPVLILTSLVHSSFHSGIDIVRSIWNMLEQRHGTQRQCNNDGEPHGGGVCGRGAKYRVVAKVVAFTDTATTT